MNPEISIIIPIYNIENYLAQTLDSLLQQTIGIKNLEVIMVNDFSSDKSGDIIDDYTARYNNFRAIHLSQNSGLPGKPRNIGLEKATGEYVMFMDHDDCYAKDAMEIFYNKITKERADVIYSRYNYFFEDGNVKSNPNQLGNTKEIVIDTIDEDRRLFKTAPAIWTRMFKRSFIMDNHIRFPEGVLAEDLSFVTQAFLKARGIIYLNNYFSYYYRIRDSEGDKSTIRIRNKKYLQAMIGGYNHTIRFLKRARKENYLPIIFEGHLKYWMNSFIYSDANPEDKKELLYEISSLFKTINKYNVELNEYSALANSISHGQFNTALQIADLMLHYKKRETKLQDYHHSIEENLRKQLEAKKIQVAELQTISGYGKYKTNNMTSRFKKRFKG